MSDLLKKLNNWPSLVLVKHDTTIEMLLVGEKGVIAEVATMWEGLKSLLGAYFTFNIEYPKQLRSLLIFVQHYIFHVKDTQNAPNIVKQVKSSLDKICLM